MKNSAKIIFHIDLNTFFCTVAAILNPALKGKAFAIGRENTFKGVISTASYEARKFGIHSGMALVDAYRKKSDLIVTSLDYQHYVEYHSKFIALLREYSDIIEVASIDEAYLDVTAKSSQIHPLEMAKEIQDKLLSIHQLPCSIGIGPTLFLAKMASDMKKPLGITVIRKREVEKILFPLSVKEIYGIGKRTYPKLIESGILTIEDFISKPNIVLPIIGERTYSHVRDCIFGRSSNVVDANRYATNQSLSTSSTYDYPLQTESDVLFELRGMTKRLVDKLKHDNCFTKTVRVIFRNLDFKTTSKSAAIEYTQDFNDIFFTVEEIIEQNYKNEPLRLVGVELANLETDIEEYNLFTFESILQKEKALKKVLDECNDKYSKKIIYRGLEKK